MTRLDRSETAPITLAGWYDPLEPTEKRASPDASIITFYGASHTVRLADALGRISDRMAPRIIGAPGATSNWSYGAYLRDRGGGNSRAVQLKQLCDDFVVLPDDVECRLSYALYRRSFHLEGNRLEVIHPPYASFDQYVKTFYDPAAWSAALRFFVENDPFYDSFVEHANILDHSALLRLLRRGHDHKMIRDLQKSVLDQSGFRPDSEGLRVARAIIHEFAMQARRDGMIPIIYLVNNLGYSDNLFRALRPAPEADNVPYLSTHTLVSPDDPRGYLPDSHFTDENDNRLAAALVELIDNGK